MDKKTLKDKLFYWWLVIMLAALYANEAYEKIYYLKYHVNFPYRYTVFRIIFVIFIITLVAIAVANRKIRDKNEVSFGRSFLIAFTASIFNNILRNKTDSIMTHAVDIDKATKDIIRWYVFGFVAVLIICTIFDSIEKKRRKKLRDTQNTAPETDSIE